MSPPNHQDPGKLAQERAALAERQHKKDKWQYRFTSETVIAALRGNEVGDASLLVAALKNRFVFDAKRRIYFRFEGGHWHKDLENEALAAAGTVLREAYSQEAMRQYQVATDPKTDEETKKNALTLHERCNRRLDKVNTIRRQKSVLELACTGKNGLVVTGDEWNSDPWLLQAMDTVIDLRTGVGRPGLPGDYINKAAPTVWKGFSEGAPGWGIALVEIFDQNWELISYVQRVLGAALVGKPSQQEFYIFWGEGRNGKGTILETLKEVLGEGLAGSIRSEMIMETRIGGGNGADPELLDLQGRRLVWTSETGDGKRLNTEKMKLFTGGDTLSSRYNYSNEIISFKPTHTLFMLTNHKPRIAAGDTAVWDRLRLIPFTMRFVDNPAAPNEKPKKINLQESLLEERSAILAWLVQGCLDWQKRGLRPPQTVTDSSEEYRLDEDFVQQFINECCTTGPAYKEQAKPLHDEFSKWFQDTYGAKATPPNLRRFSERLRKMPGITREEGRNVYFHGLALTTNNR